MKTILWIGIIIFFIGLAIIVYGLFLFKPEQMDPGLTIALAGSVIGFLGVSLIKKGTHAVAKLK